MGLVVGGRYGIGFPLLMIYVLWSRNRRYVPLDKASYTEPINPCVKGCKSCAANGRKYGGKCILLPILICMHMFQDKESEMLVRECRPCCCCCCCYCCGCCCGCCC